MSDIHAYCPQTSEIHFKILHFKATSLQSAGSTHIKGGRNSLSHHSVICISDSLLLSESAAQFVQNDVELHVLVQLQEEVLP